MKTKRPRIIVHLRNFIALSIRNMRYEQRNPESAYMRNLILRNFMFYSMFLAVIFVSCKPSEKIITSTNQTSGTTAQVTRQTEESNSGTRTENTAFKADSTVNRTQELIEKLTTEWEARLRTFDTSQPTDPTTGTPPIASELVISNKNSSDKKLTETVNTNTSTSGASEIALNWRSALNQMIDSAMQSNSKLITNTTAETKPAGWPWWAWLLTGAALIALVYLVIRYGWWRKLGWMLSVVR